MKSLSTKTKWIILIVVILIIAAAVIWWYFEYYNNADATDDATDLTFDESGITDTAPLTSSNTSSAPMTSSQPLGNSLNNPGNLRNAAGLTYTGEVTPSSNPGFKQFTSMPYGFRAMTSNLYHYVNSAGLNTISKIINTYAPSGDGNNPTSYANTVSKSSGIPIDQVLTKDDFSSTWLGLAEPNMLKIVRGMATVEQGVAPNEDDMKAGYDMFLNDEGLPT